MRRRKKLAGTNWQHIGGVADRVVEALSPETHPIIWRHWPHQKVRLGAESRHV